MDGLIKLFSKPFTLYLDFLSKLGLLVLPLYESLPRFLRVAILIMIVPVCFSLFVATAYYHFVVFNEIWR